MISATVVGNLSGDFEVKVLGDGTAILAFSVASNSRTGRDKTTTWVRCSMFGERGQKLVDYFTKGMKVAVTGQMFVREFETKAGEKKSSLEMRVADVELMSSDDDKPTTATGSKYGKSGKGNVSKYAGADDDQDIPF